MKLSEISPISFATADAESIDVEVVATVESLLGRTLARGDPLRLFLRAVELLLMQQRLLIDEVAKQNLLAFAKGEYLDRLGDLVGCERLQATAAWTTLEVTLSAPRETSTIIRQGTRVNADNEIQFATDEDLIFAPGEVVKTVKATCTRTGTAGNNFAAGELSNIVDIQPFLQSITNLTTGAGGSDIETDDDFRERIHSAPESFSCAGSEGAYRSRAMSVSALISDVTVDSSEPGRVEVYPLLQGGELPTQEILDAVYDHLNAKTVRPLTDLVTVCSPQVLEYELVARYFISREDVTGAAQIVAAADNAVNEFVEYQRSKLGRDLNPDELIYRLKKAGVKRVIVDSPQFTPVNKFSVAVPSLIDVRFIGLEDY